MRARSRAGVTDVVQHYAALAELAWRLIACDSWPDAASAAIAAAERCVQGFDASVVTWDPWYVELANIPEEPTVRSTIQIDDAVVGLVSLTGDGDRPHAQRIADAVARVLSRFAVAQQRRAAG